MRISSYRPRAPRPWRLRLVTLSCLAATALTAAVSLPASAAAQCDRGGGYDRTEIAQSVFFSTREQTKFAPSEPHYPLAAAASARYCFSRGCTGQLTVIWREDEQRRLIDLRRAIVTEETAQAELRFIRIAVLQMESWLYARLKGLDQRTVDGIMQKISRHYGQTPNESMSWMTEALGTSDRFNKECATYAMEATQHLLVLANLGLMRHWNVTAPVYRYGIPGHWTAGLENRETCERFRFDLNTRASARYSLHTRGQDPAALALENERTYSALYPGMDRAGTGRPTNRPEPPAGGWALKGPRPSVSSR